MRYRIDISGGILMVKYIVVINLTSFFALFCCVFSWVTYCTLNSSEAGKKSVMVDREKKKSANEDKISHTWPPKVSKRFSFPALPVFQTIEVIQAYSIFSDDELNQCTFYCFRQTPMPCASWTPLIILRWWFLSIQSYDSRHTAATASSSWHRKVASDPNVDC